MPSKKVSKKTSKKTSAKAAPAVTKSATKAATKASAKSATKAASPPTPTTPATTKEAAPSVPTLSDQFTALLAQLGDEDLFARRRQAWVYWVRQALQRQRVCRSGVRPQLAELRRQRRRRQQ